MEQTQAFHIIDTSVRQDLYYQYLTGGMCKLFQSKSFFLNELDARQDAVNLLAETYHQCGMLSRGASREELKGVLMSLASSGLVYQVEDKVAQEVLTADEYDEHFSQPLRRCRLHVATGWQKEEKYREAQWEEAMLMANILAKALTDSSIIGVSAHAALCDQTLTYIYSNLLNFATLPDKAGTLKEALKYFKEYAVRNRSFSPPKEYKTLAKGITSLKREACFSEDEQASMLVGWMARFYAALVREFVDTRVIVKKVRADIGNLKHPLVSKENELFGDGKFILYTRSYQANESEVLKRRIADSFYLPGAPAAVSVFAGRNIQYISGLHTNTGIGTIGTANLTANWFDRYSPEWGNWVHQVLLMFEVASRQLYRTSVKALFESSYIIPDMMKIAKTKKYTAYAMGNLDKNTYSVLLTDKNDRQALVVVNKDNLENLGNITSLTIYDDRIEATSRAGVIDSLWFHVMGAKPSEPDRQLYMN